MTALLATAAIATPLAQADANAATRLDLTNLPCTPSCPKDLAAEATTAPARIILKEGGFDWEDAGVGAGIGIAAGLAGFAGALETRRRRHQTLAR